MKRFANLFLAATVVLLLVWQLPWLVNFLSTPTGHNPFTLYSALADDFIYNEMDDNNKLHRRGISGREYTEAEADSLLPCFYMRQLVSDGRFPDSLFGVPITPQEVKQASLIERFNPRDVNNHAIALYPLLESMPKRVELEMPDDMFRCTSQGIEFITMEDNEVNQRKSQLFTQALLDKGFQFPALQISGNPTTRKSYDEGYLLLDQSHHLYQLKRCAGRPFVKQFAVADSLQLEHIFCLEPSGRQLRGLVTDVHHRLYVLTPDYQLVCTGVESYNPEEDEMMIIGNLFNWTLSVVSGQQVRYYALSADDYQLIRTFERALDDNTCPGLHFTSTDDTYCYPRF